MKIGINENVILHPDERIFCPNTIGKRCTDFTIHTIKASSIYRAVSNAHCNRIFFFMEGKAIIRHSRSQEFLIEQGQLFLLPKMTEIKCVARGYEDVRFITHTFDMPDIQDLLALQSMMRYKHKFIYEMRPLEIHPPVDDFLALLQTYLNSNIHYFQMPEMKQKELFMLFMNFYTKQENTNLFAPVIDQSIDFIATVMKYLKKAKSISELASYCNCSRASFNRLFKKHFNTTPYKWVQQQILSIVELRLSNENISLTAIADELDFSSLAHFSTFCKKYLGMTPSQYRKERVKKAEWQ